MKKNIIRYFNQGARTYHSSAELQSHVAQQVASRLQGVSAKHILEIGCGTGLLSQHLIELFPNSMMLLTDIADAMVNVTQQRFSQYPQVHTHCGDAESLDLNLQFDLITSSMTLHWFDHFRSSIENFKNYLRPGGQMIFAILGENSLCEWKTMCKTVGMTAARKSFPDYHWMTSTFADFKFEIESVKQRYANSYAFIKSLKNLGARATRADYISASTRQLRQLLRANNNEIEMTYEVIYGSYTQS